MQWFAPPEKVFWKPVDLRVIINPELGLIIGEQPYLIKLYFKPDKLTRRRARMINYLLARTCRDKVPPNCLMAILDIRRSALISHSSEFDKNLSLMLKAEATHWTTIWNGL